TDALNVYQRSTGNYFYTNPVHTWKGIVEDRDSRLHLPSYGNGKVDVFDILGNYIGAWGKGGGSSAGSFNLATYITTDASGKLYITDEGNNRVQIFQPAPLMTLFQGAAKLTSEVYSYDFGAVGAGTSNSAFPYTIINTQPSTTLSFSGTPVVALTGADAADFTFDQTSISHNLTYGITTTFTVTF